MLITYAIKTFQGYVKCAQAADIAQQVILKSNER